MTRLVQAPWQPLLGLLRPVATPGRARDEHDSSANASPEAPEAPPVEIH
jgi:hypothetical protein